MTDHLLNSPLCCGKLFDYVLFAFNSAIAFGAAKTGNCCFCTVAPLTLHLAGFPGTAVQLRMG
jgi:hypothetical protein